MALTRWLYRVWGAGAIAVFVALVIDLVRRTLRTDLREKVNSTVDSLTEPLSGRGRRTAQGLIYGVLGATVGLMSAMWPIGLTVRLVRAARRRLSSRPTDPQGVPAGSEGTSTCHGFG